MTPELLDNRYNVLSSLGRGGFGETYLAEDTQMPSRRRCVIKQLKSSAEKPDIVQLVRDRFSREAAILESVGEHPQIPTLYAYLVRDDHFYLIQEWIEGKTLTQFLNERGVLSEAEVSLLLQQLLPVLSYVHDRGLIHRDIKPDNIILRQRDGLPVLIDFGAVRETMGTKYNEIGQTTSSIVIGTPGFMPSEQAVGRPVFSSDLYALGLTAIYLLTGRYPQDLPTDPRTGEILWHSHAPNCGPHLRTIIDRTIASHPHDRYLTARDAISALLAPRPINPPAPGAFSPPPGSSPLTPSVAFPPTHPPLNSAPIAPSPITPSRSSPNGISSASPNGSPNAFPHGSPNGSPNARPTPSESSQSPTPPRPAAPPATDATVAVAPVYRPTVPVTAPARSPASPGRSPASNPTPSSIAPPSPPAVNRPHSEEVDSPSSPVGGMIKFALIAGLAGGLAIAGTHLFDRSSIGVGSMLNSEERGATPREQGAANTPDSFYFLADSAFATADYAAYANQRVSALKQAGYRGAGWFWMPEYSNLFGEEVAQVFAERFNSLDRCLKALEQYGQTVGDAYCAFASTDPNADRQLVNAQTAIAQAAARSAPVPTPAPASKPIELPDIIPDLPKIPDNRIPNPTNINPGNLPTIIDNVRGLLDGPSPIATTEKYFQQISRGNYDRSWEMLDPSYQQNANLHPAGFDSYVEWWSGSVKSVEVLKTRLVSETEDSAQVEASLRYTMTDGREVDDGMVMTWVREGDRWLCVGTD